MKGKGEGTQEERQKRGKKKGKTERKRRAIVKGGKENLNGKAKV